MSGAQYSSKLGCPGGGAGTAQSQGAVEFQGNAESEGVEELCWAELTTRYDRLVWLKLLALGMMPEEAKDLKQETWTLLIAKHRAGKLPYVQMPGLAVRQAELLALRYRRKSFRNVVELRQDVELIDRAVAHGEERLLAREELVKVRRAVEDLSPVARRVFELHFSRPALAAGQIAEQMGLSTQRVRQILCEVRKSLGARS